MTLTHRMNNLITLNKIKILCSWIRFSSHQLENKMVSMKCKFLVLLFVIFNCNKCNVLMNDQSDVDNDTLRRALMYCPGDDLRKIKKALSSEADCIALDCEDGVALNKKV